jgi:hypothetical protein
MFDEGLDVPIPPTPLESRSASHDMTTPIVSSVTGAAVPATGDRDSDRDPAPAWGGQLSRWREYKRRALVWKEKHDEIDFPPPFARVTVNISDLSPDQQHISDLLRPLMGPRMASSLGLRKDVL